MKKRFGFIPVVVLGLLLSQTVFAQDIHFSQYYNAPMLLNPANTALMPDHDFRLGANYRNQWASVPVPYSTISAYGDFQLFRSFEGNNWLGAGLALFNDKAGNGDLSLSRYEGFLAYHISIGTQSMLSVGLSAGYVQRSIDFNKLTWDEQWDGFSFNSTLANQEKPGVVKTTFLDVGAGLNYAYFPNENVYIQLGVGLAHVNQPKQSFYDMDNKLGMRPSGNIDAFFKLTDGFILNPSFYYTTQTGASNMVYGLLSQFWLGGDGPKSNQLLLGIYHRWNESIIPAFGFEFGTVRIMCSYDFTMSKLASANKSNGALELGLRYLGMYGKGGSVHNLYNCPRF